MITYNNKIPNTNRILDDIFQDIQNNDKYLQELSYVIYELAAVCDNFREEKTEEETERELPWCLKRAAELVEALTYDIKANGYQWERRHRQIWQRKARAYKKELGEDKEVS